jgi:hypothetical protein
MALAAGDAADVLRVLVVGHVYAGKTTLLRALCGVEGGPAAVARTVGCHTEATIHAGYDGRSYHVEWLEVGAASQYHDARGVYLRDFDGVLAVFDAGSERSYAAVADWLAEVAGHLADQLARHAASRHRHGGSSGGVGAPASGGGSARAADHSDGPASTRRRTGGASERPGDGVSGEGSSGAAGSARRQSSSAASEVLPQSRSQLMATALKELPLLLVANKADTVTFAPRGSRARGGPPLGAGWRHAIVSGASRTKLDVQLPISSASRSVVICGIACRRPRVQRVTLDVPVAAAVSASWAPDWRSQWRYFAAKQQQAPWLAAGGPQICRHDDARAVVPHCPLFPCHSRCRSAAAGCHGRLAAHRGRHAAPGRDRRPQIRRLAATGTRRRRQRQGAERVTHARSTQHY